MGWELYEDMYDMKRPVSKRVPMDIGNRAKQFAPFAALKGFEESIRNREIVYNEKIEAQIEKIREESGE